MAQGGFPMLLPLDSESRLETSHSTQKKKTWNNSVSGDSSHPSVLLAARGSSSNHDDHKLSVADDDMEINKQSFVRRDKAAVVTRIKLVQVSTPYAWVLYSASLSVMLWELL
jgi:hypothetical protein